MDYHTLKDIETPMQKYRNTAILFISYVALALLALSFMAYLEWPGVSNLDYDNDIAKAQAGKLNYWRSYLYSLYVALGYFFNYSKQGYLLLQLLSISLLFGSIFSTLHKYSPRLTLITGLLLLFWPINQLFSVFLIRDILAGWLTVLATIQLFEILIRSQKPYAFLVINSALMIVRPENIVMCTVGFLILLWHKRCEPSSVKKIIKGQLLGLLFFSILLPLAIGAELHRIKPFASGKEKYAYEAVSLIGPLKDSLAHMSSQELSRVDWKTLEQFLPKETWLGSISPLDAHTLTIADVNSEDAWRDFNKESYRIIRSHPLVFLKNRLEMLQHASGMGSETYYMHGDTELSSLSLLLLSLPQWLFASLLLPLLLSLYCWMQFKKFPYTSLVLVYSWSRIVPLFILQPAPHFSYSYSIFLFGFFVILLMKIEHLHWKTAA